MDTTILTAIIALTGVIISVLISFISTRLSIRNEINKLEVSILQNYSSLILEERRVRYPEMYFELSQMSKNLGSDSFNIGRPKVNIKLIQDFIFKLDESNSKNSVFFSSATASVSSKLRLYTYKLLSELRSNNADISEILDENKKKEFKEEIKDLEIFLKKDLGIFIIEFQDPKNKTTILSHRELIALREKYYKKEDTMNKASFKNKNLKF